MITPWVDPHEVLAEYENGLDPVVMSMDAVVDLHGVATGHTEHDWIRHSRDDAGHRVLPGSVPGS